MSGRWSLHCFFDDCQKKGTHIGFTNDNKTIEKTSTFGIKNCPYETLLPFLSLSFPFFCLCLYSFFTLPFPSPFLFPVLFPFLFPFLFRFLFRSFSFPFPFAVFFLSLSFSFPLSSLMWILWSTCEASAWKNDKRKKTDNVWKNHLKGLGVFTNPHMVVWVGSLGNQRFLQNKW